MTVSCTWLSKLHMVLALTISLVDVSVWSVLNLPLYLITSPYLYLAISEISDVGLEEGILKKKLLSLCYTIVYYYNGAQRYEQFLQVGRLYRALILLGLALLSSEHPCVFGLHGAIYFLLTSFSLSFRTEPDGIDPQPGCCDTVGWVMWLIKSSPKWPIVCWVER